MAIRTYKVTLDSKNSIAPEPVFLRQGDKTGAVMIDATLMDNGSPVSLSGLTPMFKANTADGQAVIADSTGFNTVNASGGEFTYQVPSQLGSVDGKIKIAYFSFSDSSGSQSTFNVVFIVKKAADMTQESAKDWVSNLNEIIDQYNQWVNSAHSSWQDFVNANKEIIESIDPGGTLLTEVIAARNGKSNLKTRLDDENAQVTEQLAQITHQIVSSGGGDDTQTIQEGIDYVHSLGGGDVLLPSENYNYSADIHVKENVCIKGKENTTLNNTATSNARIIFYNDMKMDNLTFNITEFYNDSVFLFSNQYMMSQNRRNKTGENAKVKVTNVKMISPFNDMTTKKTAVEFYATRSDIASASYAGFWGVLLDLDLDGFNTLFKMNTEKTGWINGNIIKATGIRFVNAVVVTTSTESLGIDNNEFTLKLQTTSHTRDIFVDGVSTNNYDKCTYWDMRTNTLSRVGTGLSRGSVDSTTYPNERYATYLLSKKYHLLGRFRRFTSRVQHVKINVKGYGNLNTSYLIRGFDDAVERQIMGSNRLKDDLSFFKRDVGNGEVEIYIYNNLDVEFEANIYFDSFRTFFPSPNVYYDSVSNLVELTNIIDYYPNPNGVYTRGENENGSWVQYADGTMICRVNRLSAITTNSPTGAIFFGSSSETWTYPQPFATIKNLSVQVSSALGNRWADLSSTPTATSCTYNMFSGASSEATTTVTLIATGYWY